jgi:hypothetical protein
MSDLRSSDGLTSAEPAQTPAPALPREQLLLQQAGDVIANLRSQMAELERREQNLAAQTAALESERRRLRLTVQEIDEQAQQRELGLRKQDASLAERECDLGRREEDLTRQTQELEARIGEQEQRWKLGLESIDSELAAERESREASFREELRALAEQLAEERGVLEQDHAQLREQLKQEAAELRKRIEELRDELETVRQEKLSEVELRETQLHRREVELEKRTRFHESHLNQLRRSVEEAQANLDRAQQKYRERQLHATEELDRQRQHLIRARDRLIQREDALERERHLVEELRRTVQLRAEEEQSRWLQERQQKEEESEAHLADFRRQRDMLALHAQNLEARRTRLDHIRDELERNHRETLELQAAVERVWEELCGTHGEETAALRLKPARTALQSHYEELQKSLKVKCDEIRAAEGRLEEQRLKFRSEREGFTQWMTQRELQLQDREESLQRDIQLAAEHEAEWRRTRERWTLEKIEAESVIRQLLEELDSELLPVPRQDSDVSRTSISDDGASIAA